MKKSLIAVAVAAALPAAAFAQNSVTLYGVADASLSDSNASGSKTQMSSKGTLNNGTPRIGVRGTEDLGGGLKASFNYELGVSNETGATDSNLFARQSWLELSGGFGGLRIGRALNPSFFGVAAWELTGTANYSVVAQMFSFGGAGPRNNSQWMYTSPTMGGFSFAAGYVTETDNGGNAKLDANVIYRGGPLAVGLSYNKEDNSEKNWALGGRYSFGNFALAASYQDPAGAIKGFTIGGKATLGPASLVVDVARDSGSATKSTDYVVEVLYPLSKRTTVYGAYLRDGSASLNQYGIGVRHNF